MKDESDIIKDMVSKKGNKKKGSSKKRHGSSNKGELAQHKHCDVCFKAIPFNKADNFCSSDCREIRTEKVKRARRQQYIILAIMAAAFIFVVFSGLR